MKSILMLVYTYISTKDRVPAAEFTIRIEIIRYNYIEKYRY